MKNVTHVGGGGSGASCDMKFGHKRGLEPAEISQNFSKFLRFFLQNFANFLGILGVPKIEFVSFWKAQNLNKSNEPDTNPHF